MVLPSLGGPEVLIVALIIMVLFGAKKLPELARSLGRSKGEFEKGKADFKPESGSKSRVELEKAAKELGIDTEGKTDEELKNLIKDSL